jgi:hypothetical protein
LERISAARHAPHLHRVISPGLRSVIQAWLAAAPSSSRSRIPITLAAERIAIPDSVET